MSILIRAQALIGYPELVRQHGGDPKALLARYGLSLAQLGDSRAFVSYRDFMALLEETAAELGKEEFGLELSNYQDIGMMGLVGLFLQQSTNLRTFIVEAIEKISAHNQGEDWELRVEGGIASIYRHERRPAVRSNRQGRELAVGVLLHIVRQLIGQSWQPLWISFIHGPAGTLSSYRKCLRAEVRFNQEFDGMVFDAADLDTNLANASDQVRELLRQYLSNLEFKYSENVSEQVRVLIRHTMNHQGCNLDNIARLMAFSPRTLQRRLARRGDTFKGLLNEVRIEVACQFLQETRLPLTQLSLRLGYTGPSAFTRAFRQQMGLSPLAYRKSHRPDDA